MTTVQVVSVRSGVEVSRAELDDDTGVVHYSGGDTAAALVRTWRLRNDGSDADAVRALARDGWSNGYLMVSNIVPDEETSAA